MQNSKYDDLLSAVKDYVTVKPVDTPKTIYLVGKAKGDRGYREFSSEIGTSISFLSYVLNGNSFKIKANTIAGLVSAAAAQSGVTLDNLMDAQGWIHKKDLDTFEADYRSNIRRILIDEFLEAGYEVAYSEKYHPERDPTNTPVMLQLKKPGSEEFITFDFKIRTCPIVKATDNVNAMITFWLNETIKVNFLQKNRLFLVVDNPAIYQKILKKVERVRIPNDISLLLIDPQKRMMVSENTVPRSDGEQAAPMFPPCGTEVDWTSFFARLRRFTNSSEGSMKNPLSSIVFSRASSASSSVMSA